MNDVYVDKPAAWCPNCISFKTDCHPDYEDYGKPCDRYQPIPTSMEVEDPKTMKGGETVFMVGRRQLVNLTT